MAASGGGLHLLETISAGDKQYGLVHRGNTANVVSKVSNSPESRSFAKLIQEDALLQRLFSPQWTQVSLLNELSLPVYFSKTPGRPPPAAVIREAQKGSELGSFTMERIMKAARPKIEEWAQRVAEKLEAQGTPPGTIDQQAMLLAVLQAMGLFTAGAPTTAWLRLLAPFEDYFADDLMDLGVSLLSATKIVALSLGLTRREGLLKSTGMDEKSYEAALLRLLEDGYAKPLLSLFWCEHHQDIPTSFYVVGHRRPPTAKCDVCGRVLRHGTFLFLTSAAMALARQRQGPLLYLLSWNLEQRGIPWGAQVYVQGIAEANEVDLVYRVNAEQGYVVGECKSYATDVPERTVETNLRKQIGQLSDKVTALNKAGIPLSKAILVTNYFVTKQRKAFVKSMVRAGAIWPCKKVDVVLIGPNNFPDLPGLERKEEIS